MSEPLDSAFLGTDVDTEVRALYTELIESWNRQDATGMANCFSVAGNAVGFDGSQMNGRAQIGTVLASLFAAHTMPPFVFIVRSVRPLGPDIALLQAVVGMVSPGESDINPAVNAVQSMIANRAEGRWLAELLQSTPAAFHGRPDEAAALTEELRRALRDNVSKSH